MKIEYDPETDAAYLYLKYPVKDSEAKKTVRVKDDVILDYDAKGKLLGIEILHASKVLIRKALQHKPTQRLSALR